MRQLGRSRDHLLYRDIVRFSRAQDGYFVHREDLTRHSQFGHAMIVGPANQLMAVRGLVRGEQDDLLSLAAIRNGNGGVCGIGSTLSSGASLSCPGCAKRTLGPASGGGVAVSCFGRSKRTSGSAVAELAGVRNDTGLSIRRGSGNADVSMAITSPK